MRKLLFILMLLPVTSFGESNLSELKFEIIKETIEFLASDTRISQARNFDTDCKEGDYECLSDFCLENNVEGASKKVSLWKEIQVGTISELVALRDRIYEEIIVQNNKSYRKELPGYNNYFNSISAVISSADQLPSNPLPVNTEPEKSAAVDGEQFKTEDQNSGNYLSLLAFILSLIACGAGMYSILKLNKINKVTSGISNQESRISNLYKDLGSIKMQIESKADKQSLLAISDKLDALSTRLQEKENQIQEAMVGRNIQTIREEELIVNNPVKFAKVPDLKNGFSNSILVENQNGEQIYEITIFENTATYKISTDINAQKYALTDFNYYLSNACTFVNQPVKGSRIQTNEAGTLKKEAQNWIIESRAIIEFK